MTHGEIIENDRAVVAALKALARPKYAPAERRFIAQAAYRAADGLRVAERRRPLDRSRQVIRRSIIRSPISFR